MKKTIDCLFVGHNEIDFSRYEQMVRGMGTDSGAYKDLDLNFIWYDNEPYSVTDIFNLFTSLPEPLGESPAPLGTGDTFSNTIAYLGTYLHRRGFTFAYVNTFQDEKDRLKQILENENPLAVAVTTTLYVSPLPIAEIVDFIKKYNRETVIIIGGPFISTQVRVQDTGSLEHLFKEVIGADIYVYSSQGEATLVNILEALKQNLPLTQINNIYYKTNQGYVSTPTVTENNLLTENLVKWDLFSHKLGEVVNIRTSISCPFSCAFCGFPQHAGKYQAVEAEKIMEELAPLNRIQSVEMINVVDDTFNIPKNRFKELLRLMIKNQFNPAWVSNFRSQYADRETVELMKASGCEGVFLGIESGSDRILENMNKAASVAAYREGIALLKEYGIATMGSFIIGFPGETEETVHKTFQFIKESGLDFYRAQLWYCDPITPIWNERETYNLIGESFEWSHSTMDSRSASRLVDRIFLDPETPAWVPQYHFGFDKIWSLKHRGMNLEQIKTFLRAFNSGIKQKLENPSKKEISIGVVKQLKNSLRDAGVSHHENKKKTGGVDADNVRFNF